MKAEPWVLGRVLTLDPILYSWPDRRLVELLLRFDPLRLRTEQASQHFCATVVRHGAHSCSFVQAAEAILAHAALMCRSACCQLQ